MSSQRLLATTIRRLFGFQVTLPHQQPASQCSRWLGTFAHTDETFEQIQARIFGNHIGNGLRSGRKVLSKVLMGNKVASYYMDTINQRDDPLFVDMEAEKRKLKLDKLKRRGKAPPKKGQGKRSKKK